MWPKLKEQLPAIILTAVLISGAAFWLHVQTVKEMAAQQEAVLQPMREQNEALKATAEENRRQIEATNKLLKDAISKREADLFRTDDEVQKLNTQRMDALAEAIVRSRHQPRLYAFMKSNNPGIATAAARNSGRLHHDINASGRYSGSSTVPYFVRV